MRCKGLAFYGEILCKVLETIFLQLYYGTILYSLPQKFKHTLNYDMKNRRRHIYNNFPLPIQYAIKMKHSIDVIMILA